MIYLFCVVFQFGFKCKPRQVVFGCHTYELCFNVFQITTIIVNNLIFVAGPNEEFQ